MVDLNCDFMKTVNTSLTSQNPNENKKTARIYAEFLAKIRVLCKRLILG